LNRGRRPVRRRSASAARDQHESAFARILADLVTRVPGAQAAALVDLEGETVDYWGRLSPFDVKLAAAQWRVVIDDIRRRADLTTATFLAIRASRASYQVHVLPEGYALVLVLSRGSGHSGWRRAVASCGQALAAEASWGAPRSRVADWYGVVVSADAKRRPVSLGKPPSARPLEVLGALASGIGARERGWRVRLDDGVEATLVREAGGNWYVDELRALPTPPGLHPRKSR
jgi:hypothetical protein